jgi:hypothetical protein
MVTTPLVEQVPFGKAKDEPDGEQAAYVTADGDTVIERTPMLMVAVVPPLVLAPAGAHARAPSAQTAVTNAPTRMLPIRVFGRVPERADAALASRTMVTRNRSLGRTAVPFRLSLCGKRARPTISRIVAG